MAKPSDVCRNRSISVKREGDVFVLSIIGDFDSSTTPAVHQCCKKVEKSAGVRKVVIDFAQSAHVDTTAFACIVNFIKEHLGTATEIAVTNLREPEKNLLHILKIEKIVRET